MSFLQEDADVAVTVETIANCLSLLCKTGDGLQHAYVRFDAPDQYVKRMYIRLFYHIIEIKELNRILG